MQKIALLGAGGQLGREFVTIGSNDEKYSLYPFRFADLDITSSEDRSKLLEINPDWIVNCAAYTKVDHAEDNEAAAYAVNSEAVHALALMAKEMGATMIHVSTDYVYHNELNRPLVETDPCYPQGVYAMSKYEGEQKLRGALAEHYVLRTSWVYSRYSPNFVKTMLRLSENLPKLSVVDDQIGSPTYVADLTAWIFELIERRPDYGTYNLCNSGVCSWFDFAKFIFDTKGIELELEAISTEAFGAKAPRPKYSVLNCDKADHALTLSRRDWKEAVSELLRIL